MVKNIMVLFWSVLVKRHQKFSTLRVMFLRRTLKEQETSRGRERGWGRKGGKSYMLSRPKKKIE